jgi:O-antigen/teichoic acid export membrane protein
MSEAPPQDIQRVRSLNRDTLLYLPGRAVPAVMMLITAYLLTRFFSETDVGRYDLAMRLATFMTTIAAMWLTMSIMRLHPAYERRQALRPFYRAVVTLRGSGIALGLVAMTALRFWGPERLLGPFRDLLAAGALVFVAQSFLETGLAATRANGLPIRFSMASVINALVRLPLGLVLAIYVLHNISGMLWATAAVPLLVYIVFLRRFFTVESRERTAPGVTREIMAYGVPIGITLTLNFLLANADRFLLNYLRHAPAEVGIFSITSQLVDQPMALALQTMMLAVFPAVAEVYERAGKARTEVLVTQSTRTYLLICLPIGALLSVLAYPILHALTARPSYWQAYTLAPWLASATFVYGLTYFAGFGLHLSKRTDILLYVTAIAIAINLCLNWLFIPAHGYLACGVTRLAANCVLLAGTVLVSNRFLPWHFPWRTLLRVLVAAGAATALAYATQKLLPLNIFVLGLVLALGMTAYGMFLLGLREIAVEDVRGLVGSLMRRKSN